MKINLSISKNLIISQILGNIECFWEDDNHLKQLPLCVPDIAYFEVYFLQIMTKSIYVPMNKMYFTIIIT